MAVASMALSKGNSSFHKALQSLVDDLEQVPVVIFFLKYLK